MQFNFDEEQLAFRKMAGEFAQKKLWPYASKWDKESIFPVEILKEAGKLGLAGIYAKSDINGSNVSRLNAALIFEQLASGCVTTSAFLSIHNMVTGIIDNYANDELRNFWGPKLTSMQAMGSYCLTEPEAGSDAQSLKTTAVLQDDHYILNGTKAFISGAGVSDVYICMARTGDDAHKGISCFLIEKDNPGISFGKLEDKMGWKSQPTRMVFLEDCKIPRNNLIGEEGMGFKIALRALDGGRINIAACSLGGAKACLKLTHDYMHQRKQFKKTLSEMQVLRFYFADMVMYYEAAKLMVYRAARAYDDGDSNVPLLCAMAKKMASDVAFKITDKAMQLHGGYGYLHEYQIERIFRDLRVHQILEGTNEIMSEIIAKNSLDNEFEFINY